MGKRVGLKEFEQLVDGVVAQIEAGEWRPDLIVALSRGGFIPATCIAQRLRVRDMVGIDVIKDVEGKRSIGRVVQFGDLTDRRVLVVDDGIISGRLLALTAEAVRVKGGDPRTCALISEGKTADPDYVVETRTTIPDFWWEV